ncbi:MAG: phosphoribosylanthranilate isomerase [Phycisphaerales bacterium]|nr:phosphoribosylanthranilate isomerase [Phycisphaerales bacterium]
MNHRTRIKVCGITTPEMAAAAVDSGADAIGFVFVENTPRYIDPDDATEIMFSLPPMVSAVGVIRDLDVDQFCELEQRCPTQLMQLHGKESVDVVKQCGPGVIKAFRFDQATIESQLARWNEIDEVDAVLIDGSDGGTGEAFDWKALTPHLDGFDKPVILAGGLDATNVADAIRTIRPYAVDVSSGVESSPGIKDPAKIAAFCAAVRAADAG